MYAVVRTYSGEGASELFDLLGQREQDVQALISGVPGFVNYVAVRSGDGGVTVTVCEDKAGTDESARRAAEWVKDNAWGHHASCSCRMGSRDDARAVVDSRFRVHGVTGLRIVDASVFPKIPGFFIAAAVYMISEKASDVIAEDAGVTPPRSA